MEIKRYLSEEVISAIKKEIENANGNEVFFCGKINDEAKTISIETGSRGNINTVPINLSLFRDGDVLIHNHPGGNLTPSKADLGIAEIASENGKGFYIINNTVTDIYAVMEPIKPIKIKELDYEQTAYYLSKDGPLSKISDSYEERISQIELLKNISIVFNKNSIGVFEAGTGVGKSYAYLIPSVLWVLNNKEKIIISTGTINLQQQICEKDLPAVEKIIGKKVKFILMKGRQNYICLRRLNDAASLLDLFDNETDELQKIIDFSKTTKTGSKSDLTFMPDESIWTKINSESDACMGMKCPYHNECFVMKVRKEAASANIIVVNHHLLFADIESRMDGAGYDDAAVLPPYRRIIFDEAHGIESAATSFFSENLSKFKLNKLLNQMYRRRKTSESGFLCNIAILSSNDDKMAEVPEIYGRIKNAIVQLEIAGMDLLERDYTKRICFETAREFGPCIVAVSELANYLGQFTDIIRLIIDGIDDDDKDTPSYYETKIILRRLDSNVILLKNFCAWDEKKENVFWIQKRRLPPDMVKNGESPDYVILNQTPLDISSMMNNGVYEEMKTVVCTSATLKTGRDYNYWKYRSGISFVEPARVLSKEFLSPFPYEKNMLIAVPSDAPFADNMEYQQYIEMAIPRLINAAEGRTLVLFTSYDSLKSAYRATVATLKGFTGRIMKQGDDDNAKLLEAFKNEKESVLFATDSYWQGVDVPGESLSQVIIVKLPFTVPNDPVYLARAEAITKKGGNSFMELSVPEAVIKFRQGVGRLIRKSDDKGVVVILDRRIFEKRYGSIFIASLPECKKIYEPLSDITKKINSFIFD